MSSITEVITAATVAALALAASSITSARTDTAGGELAFARGGDIYAVRADGTGPRKLTSGRIYDGNPAYSPDGEQVAFVRETAGNAEIYVADADGGNPVRLTRTRGTTTRPRGRRTAAGSRSRRGAAGRRRAAATTST